jgi:hypothetical protein
MPALSFNLRKRSSFPGQASSWLALLGMLCIALVLVSGVAQVAHSHASGQPDHDCSLCASAHHVIQIVASVQLDQAVRAVTAVAVGPASAVPKRQFFFKLSCRPPPADPAFA